MIVIGIAGGVASGKSLVAEKLRSLGAAVFYADQAGHEVLRQSEVKQQLAARWGRNIFDEQGELDRRKIAKIVFDSTPQGRRERAFLEEVTHPQIAKLALSAIEQARREKKPALALDAALLFEAGWNKFCNAVWFVHAPYDQRLKRVADRDWSEAELTRREAAQWPLEEKRARADRRLVNDKTPDDLFHQVEQGWRETIVSAQTGASPD